MRIEFLKSGFGNDVGDTAKIVDETDGELYYYDGFRRYCYVNKSEEGISYRMWKAVIDRPEKQKPDPLTYYAYYKCTNCGKEDNLQITKGVLASKVAKCPKCGCMTMRKVAR